MRDLDFDQAVDFVFSKSQIQANPKPQTQFISLPKP